jgi:mannitol/fructose-specific phosphotransferase system IIA component (Ntr-type)
MSYLSDLLREEEIKLSLAATEKATALSELVALVPELKPDQRQREAFLKALLDREKLHTTGVGDGIAMPHTRLPLGGVLKRSLLVFGRSQSGLAYDSLDHKPVHLVFLLASPNLTDHLAMLARLSRVLRDQKVRKALMEAATPREVIDIVNVAELRGT